MEFICCTTQSFFCGRVSSAPRAFASLTPWLGICLRLPARFSWPRPPLPFPGASSNNQFCGLRSGSHRDPRCTGPRPAKRSGEGASDYLLYGRLATSASVSSGLRRAIILKLSKRRSRLFKERVKFVLPVANLWCSTTEKPFACKICRICRSSTPVRA